MADDDSDPEVGDEEASIKDRIEERRANRTEEDQEGSRGRGMEEMMGGGGPGGMGGNPMAQMMGGMMGGGPGAMGGGPGGGPSVDTEPIERELELLRDELKDATAELRRIANTLED